jgi:uncharacterized membrane protein YoaK (UPF0700 family)
MFHHKIDRETPNVVIFHWLLLSFLGGNINSGGLLACGRFVSHMTGFYTLFGQSAANFTWGSALGLLSIAVYFLIGVMISALLIERPIHRGDKPHYVFVMGLMFVCLVSSSVLGNFGFFGNFGETHLKTEYLLLALLCMASGLLNGAVSIASGHTVRVTHMTGNTTDLGVGIVRTLSVKKNTTVYQDELRAVGLRTGIIASFTLGSAAGAVLFIRFRYDGFLLPAAIALYTMIWETYFNLRNKKTGISTLIFIPSFLRKSDNRS